MLEIMQTFHFLHNLWNKMKINVIIRYDLIVLSYCFMYQILYRTFGNHAMKLELEETFRPKKNRKRQGKKVFKLMYPSMGQRWVFKDITYWSSLTKLRY